MTIIPWHKVVAGLTGAALVVLADEAAASAAADGHRLAETLCARCHAIEAQGSSPLEAAPPFRELAHRWPPEDLAEALAEGIVVGHPEMPEFRFEPDQIGALITYLNSLLTK